MANAEDEPVESPATWENVVVGEAKKVVGHALGDEDLEEEGAEQIEIAHELREEYREHHQHEPHTDGPSTP